MLSANKENSLGLAGSDIDPGARILAVAEVHDAFCSDRPYRAGMLLEKEVAIIKDGSATQFDPEVVAAFLRFIAERHDIQPKSNEGIFGMSDLKVPEKAVG